MSTYVYYLKIFCFTICRCSHFGHVTITCINFGLNIVISIYMKFEFNTTSLSACDFSTLYTSLPHNLVIDILIDLIESTFQREGSPYLACNARNVFLTSEQMRKYKPWSCQNVCDALTFLLDNIFIQLVT